MKFGISLDIWHPKLTHYCCNMGWRADSSISWGFGGILLQPPALQLLFTMLLLMDYDESAGHNLNL